MSSKTILARYERPERQRRAEDARALRRRSWSYRKNLIKSIEGKINQRIVHLNDSGWGGAEPYRFGPLQRVRTLYRCGQMPSGWVLYLDAQRRLYMKVRGATKPTRLKHWRGTTRTLEELDERLAH